MSCSPFGLKFWFKSIVSCVLYMRFWFLLMCYFKCWVFQGSNLSICVSMCRYVQFLIEKRREDCYEIGIYFIHLSHLCAGYVLIGAFHFQNSKSGFLCRFKMSSENVVTYLVMQATFHLMANEFCWYFLVIDTSYLCYVLFSWLMICLFVLGLCLGSVCIYLFVEYL